MGCAFSKIATRHPALRYTEHGRKFGQNGPRPSTAVGRWAGADQGRRDAAGATGAGRLATRMGFPSSCICKSYNASTSGRHHKGVACTFVRQNSSFGAAALSRHQKFTAMWAPPELRTSWNHPAGTNNI